MRIGFLLDPTNPACVSNTNDFRAWLRAAGHTVHETTQLADLTTQKFDWLIVEGLRADVFSPASQALSWSNVVLRFHGPDAYQSTLLQTIQPSMWKWLAGVAFASTAWREVVAAQVQLPIPQEVLPFGVALPDAVISSLEKQSIACVCPLEWDQGLQAVLLWAASRPDLNFRCVLTAPRHAQGIRVGHMLMHDLLPNIEFSRDVSDLARWFDETRPAFVLSAAPVAEVPQALLLGMAKGATPLVYAAPGVDHFWPHRYVWKTLAQLDALVARGPDAPEASRAFVAANYDVNKCAPAFLRWLDGLPSTAPKFGV